MSRPRAATSVATSSGAFPLRKRSSAYSRSAWSLSPWIAPADRRPMAFIFRSMKSHRRLVPQNTMPRAPSTKFSLRTAIALSSFWSSVTSSTVCLMDLFAVSLSPLLPMRTSAASGWRNVSAILRTPSGHVAVNMSVCRAVGHSLMIFLICGSNPMSSIRSASSRTT